MRLIAISIIYLSGGSNEYPQFMFWSKNKKNRYTPAYPSFTIQKWGLVGIHCTDLFS